MGNLGLWDLLTLIGAERKHPLQYLAESQTPLKEDRAIILLENFAQAVSYTTGWYYSQPTKEDFEIIFVDIKNSTRLLINSAFAEKVFEFLSKAFQEFNWLHPQFKFVGDGVLFLKPTFHLSLHLLRRKKLQKAYLNLKRSSPEIDFRIVGGLGELYCIEFETAQGTLKECVGCPISYLVKKSKEVDTYEWFGEITPEKCRELLNS